MKTKPATSLKNFWLMLTEVPGWPDAPLWARVRRASPVLLPCLMLLLVGGWQIVFKVPQIRAERAALAPLIALENEIASLQLACSDQDAAALAERSAEVSRLLLASSDDVRSFLKILKKEAVERGFDASFVSSDEEPAAAGEEAAIVYVPVRGKLVPAETNTEPFPALLAWLERAGALGKRIDLMRLSIRADDKTWQAVEMNLRLIAPPPNEKIP